MTQPKPSRPVSSSESLPAGWNWFTTAPLKGCGLMRERQWVWAWDDANSIYLLDVHGQLIAQRRAPRELIAVAGSDNGQAVVAVSRTKHLWWLNRELEPLVEIELPFDPLAVAIDPFGQYAVVSSHQGKNLICSSGGGRVAHFETNRPLKFLAFIATTGSVVGAAEHGLVTCYDFKGQNEWYATLWSNAGSMAVDGDGQAVLLACFTHGLVRFDCNGAKEGVYRFEHSPALVATDFDCSTILTASLEDRLTLLDYEGMIRGDRVLTGRPVALALDALGRYGVLGLLSGELILFRIPDHFSTGRTEAAAAPPPVPLAPKPAWEIRGADSIDEAASTVMETVPLDDRLALFSSRRTLRILDGEGRFVHETPGLPGVGRTLCRGENWLIAATDSTMLAYNPAENRSVQCTLGVHEISHLALFDAFGDTLLVEACEHLCRFVFPDRRVWQRRLEYKVETVAVLPSGLAAVTLDDFNLIVYGADGRPIGKFRPRRPEPIKVLALDDGWATTTRYDQTIRGHEPDGSLLWSIQLPWPPWATRRLGPHVVATSEEGCCVVLSQQGNVIAQSAEPREHAQYFLYKDGNVAKLFQVDQTLVVTTVDGRLLWRHTDEHKIGRFLAGPRGVWVFVGRTLSYLAFPD